MKIGLEVTGCLTDTPTGIANYIMNLHNELETAGAGNQIESFVWLPKYSQRKKLLRHFTPRRLSWHYKYYNFHRLFNDLDISHSTDSKFLNLPNTKHVVTVHDLAIFKKETTEIPDYTTAAFRHKMLGKLRYIAEKADRIITDSHQTKRDFLDMFPDFDADLIDPVHLAGSLSEDLQTSDDEGQILRQFGVAKKEYFMFIGAVSVRKNLINMIEAFKASGLSADTKFLVIGFMSMGLERIIGTIEKHGLTDRVVLADYIDERLIPTLYRNSLGLAFATYYEGFGIPIVEAMKFRTPVMHGNIGSAPEIGKDHGISVDPFSVDEIAAGFRELTVFAPERLEKAYHYSKGFTWKKTADKTLEVYRKMLQ